MRRPINEPRSLAEGHTCPGVLVEQRSVLGDASHGLFEPLATAEPALALLADGDGKQETRVASVPLRFSACREEERERQGDDGEDDAKPKRHLGRRAVLRLALDEHVENLIGLEAAADAVLGSRKFSGCQQAGHDLLGSQDFRRQPGGDAQRR